MASSEFQAWLQKQYPRRFYFSFREPVYLKGPLFAGEVPLSSQQTKEGFTGFWPEYPSDAERKTWRVSPIFADVKAAVSWLTKAASTWRSPFPGQVHLYTPEYGSSDTHDGSVVFELSDRYGGHAYADDLASSPLPTVVFRGQQDVRYGLIPRLYQVFQNTESRCWEAKKRFKAEVEKTRRFTSEFFTDPDRFSVLRDLGLPDLSRLGVPSRAAVARHYGYHSQFIDFTADVGVAALFATLGPVPDVGIGSIWYLDEAYLQRVFSGSAVIRMPRYEHRLLFQSSVNELRSRLIDEEPAGRFNWAGPPEAWDRAAKFPLVKPFTSQRLPSVVLAPVQFSISLYFAPGPIIPRMNAQAWCAVELNSHLGWHKGNVKAFISLHKLLERFTGRVSFIHQGWEYERPARNELGVPPIYRQEISSTALFPKGDPIGQAIEHYQTRVGSAPT